MSLNPVQFGAEVIDQFGRYLMTTFPIADTEMEAQVRDHLRHDLGGERLIAKGPYVSLNRPFEEGPTVSELCSDPAVMLHGVLKHILPFETLHKHQELALRAIKAGKHTVVATGTGSGKTESFLLPIIDHCLRLRDEGEPEGVVAVIVYPMNALADDQLRRLRPLLAGTRVTFGRYTGVTPEDGEPEQGRLGTSRAYSADEMASLAEGREEKVPIPQEECFHRSEIRLRRPRILLTNYSQLEYLLLRDKDLDLFRGAPLRFMVFDEVHTYTGAVGSEVACLIRRLRHVARKSPSEVISIGTSATVQENESRIDAAGATREFASRLFGVPAEDVVLVTEHFKRKREAPPAREGYVPAAPEDARKLLEEVLASCRDLQLRDEVHDLPGAVLDLCGRLCGKDVPEGGTSMERAYLLLGPNRVVQLLADQFKSPSLLSEGLQRLRSLRRDVVDDDALVAEMLCYLTLGALVQHDGEPLLRPKLHYFVQGYQGLGCVLGADGKPTVHFDADAAHDDEGALVLPMSLCRSCGQHYFRLIASEPVRAEGADIGVSTVRVPDRDREPEGGELLVYLTTALVCLDEGDGAGKPPVEAYICRYCGAMHDAHSARCLNPRCGRPGSLVPVKRHDGVMKTCLACGTAAKGYDEIVTPAKSSEVADVTILAQSMLTAMSEESLQKLLVFTDNRQDAAFQAGWMEERSRRFRLRHILYATLEQEPERVWSLTRLTEHVVDLAKDRGVLKPGVWDDEDNLTRVRWFLLEEFASTGQRRSSLETLALAEVLIHGAGVEEAPRFYERWSRKLGVSPGELENLVRLVLDYYRRRGVVSDPLLCRKWSDRDVEVRKGLVSVYDQYRPQALVFAKEGQGSYTKAWVARNGRSGAQEIIRKGLPQGKKLSPSMRDELLQDLWEWLGDREHELLVPTTLTYKHRGRQKPLDIPGSPRQINVEKLGFRVADRRQLCPSCRRAQSVSPPSGACPEYGCRGRLTEEGRDEDHFDVHQYTRRRFVPLKTWEHSAQVPKEDRIRIEREFKRETGGRFNCLVCTPTLEMGVDIGKLEMALMRNVPPTPANYAQRAGRAGRRHRIAVVFTHCRGGSHGRYYFENPSEMIAGEIRVPAFSMRNEPLIRKHAHSAILTALRELADEEEQKVLNGAFPPAISGYFADMIPHEDRPRPRYLDQPRDLGDLARLVTRHRQALVETLRCVFSTWPRDEAAAVSDETLERFVDDFHDDLRAHVNRLFAEVQTYREELRKLRRVEDEGLTLTDEQETLQRRCKHALRSLLDPGRQENYALSYLSVDGFFPGYAMSREAVSAQCLEPYIEVSRPAAIALRELTPANFIYANKNVFRVRKLNFHKLREDDDRTTRAVLHRALAFDPVNKRVFEPALAATEGGHGQAPITFGSYRLTDVEMRHNRDIDDRERGRRRVPFVIYGMALSQHAGGTHGQIGPYGCKYLRRQAVRLVNLGLPGKESPFTLFPICSVCGATRSPNATEGELERFREDHRSLHGKETTDAFALHVELISDALHIGPFQDQAPAVNLFESIRIGAGHVLDMGTTEVEGFIVTDEHGGFWTIMYDPMPGGSGFLPQIVRYWETICERARHALESCGSRCETACYSCLKHFRNQMDHDLLNRHNAINVLMELGYPMELEHRIPPVASQPQIDGQQPDSDAEIDFAQLCQARGFPVPPAAQYRVTFEAGSYTDADWAYPDQKVLVFIDGMGPNLHGDPERRRRDRLLRAKAKMKGYQVVEITAEALQDEGSLAFHFDELAVYLGRE